MILISFTLNSLIGSFCDWSLGINARAGERIGEKIDRLGGGGDFFHEGNPIIVYYSYVLYSVCTYHLHD